MTGVLCHGTLVVLASKGVLIRGPSGTGKSTLALKLIVTGMGCGVFSRLVSDDQVRLSVEQGTLIGSVPPSIAGLVEVWGVGPTPIAHQESAKIDLLVRLVPKVQAPRLNDEENQTLEGVALPVIELEEKNAEAASLAIMAKLRLGPFATC